MADTYINYGAFEGWATKLDSMNKDLRQQLDNIQKKVNGLNGDAYESNSAVSIRGKITDMTPRFQQYQDVVESYITFIKNTAAEYKTTEAGRDKNAQSFL